MRPESRKKLLTWLSITLAVAFVLSLGWGILEYRALNVYKIETENQYKQAFNDLSSSLNEVETCMAKAKVANSPAQKVFYLGETWKGSQGAVSRLGQLPADEVGISYVTTLMNQVSDYSKGLTKKVAAEDSMSPLGLKTFDDMNARVIEVNRAVQNLYNQFYSQNLTWVDKPFGLLKKMGIGKSLQTAAQGNERQGQDNANAESASAPAQSPTSVRGGLKQLDVSLQKFPPLTYQGELDQRYVNNPLGLPKGEINESKAVEVAKDFLQKIGYTGATPQLSGLSQSPLGGYNLTYQTNYLEVSKQGGVVTFYRDQREIGERKLDEQKTLASAYAGLKKLGWNLTITSYQDLGSYIQVDAVPIEDKVILYPDKIRLTVATDNGQIIGFDADAYYAYHHDRKLNAVLTMDQAKTKLNKDFKVLEDRLALISKAGTTEAFCYEFRGTAFGEEYLVYINATNGTEEKISRIINTPNGKLIQ